MHSCPTISTYGERPSNIDLCPHFSYLASNEKVRFHIT